MEEQLPPSPAHTFPCLSLLAALPTVRTWRLLDFSLEGGG